MVQYAIAHVDNPSMCVIRNGEIVNNAVAQRAGYQIVTLADADTLGIELDTYKLSRFATPSGRLQARQAEKVSAQMRYYTDLMKLPEATGRIKAVEKIAACHNATSMPLERAALFLAGLPLDEQAPPPRRAGQEDALLKRKAEIRLAGLRHRFENGDVTVREEANALSYALKLNVNQNMPMVDALDQCGVELE